MPSPGTIPNFRAELSGAIPIFRAGLSGSLRGARLFFFCGPLLEDGRQSQKAKDEENSHVKELKIRPPNCYSKSLRDRSVELP